MIDEGLERMKRKHNGRVHFDADSFQISDCTVAPVHDIPDVIHENQEFDFMLSLPMIYICFASYIVMIVL